MTATLSSLFAGATKEPGKLLRFHVSLRIFTALSLLVATRLANRGGNNA